MTAEERRTVMEVEVGQRVSTPCGPGEVVYLQNAAEFALVSYDSEGRGWHRWGELTPLTSGQAEELMTLINILLSRYGNGFKASNGQEAIEELERILQHYQSLDYVADQVGRIQARHRRGGHEKTV